MQPQENTSGAPVPMVVVAQMAPADTHTRCRNTMSVFSILSRLGWTQVAIGIACVICQIISLGVGIYIFDNRTFARFMGNNEGIWIGAAFIVTGVIGVIAGQKRITCQVTAFNVLSILSSLLAAVLVADAIPVAMIAYYMRLDYSYNDYSTHNSDFFVETKLAVAMESLLIIFGVAEAVIAICSSVFCCKIGACCCHCCSSCCPKVPQHHQFYNIIQPDLEQQQQFINTNQQQPMFNPGQQQLMFNPNQQQIMFNPNQQQLMFNANQQQLMFNPNQQLLMLSYNQQQPMLFAAQMMPSQQPEISASLPGAADHRQDGTTAVSNPAANRTTVKFDDEEAFSSVYDYDAEYRY